MLTSEAITQCVVPMNTETDLPTELIGAYGICDDETS